MKRLEFVSLKVCPHCRRAVAYLMIEDGEHTLGIALDASRARELSTHQEPGREKFLTDLLMQLLASSSYIPRQVVLDWNEEGFLFAKVDLTTQIFSCSAQDGIAFVAAAGIPFYATERILAQRHLFHPPDTESESTDLIQLKLKPTLH